MLKNLLKQNYILIKIEEFQKLNSAYQEFLKNFFEIKPHEIYDNLIVLEKKEKYLPSKFF